MNFSEEELKQLPNTISITRQIARTHFGLGLRVAFLKTCDCGNMGVIQVGVPGIGKTMCLLCLKHYLSHRKIFSKKFTLAGVKKKFNEFFTNSEVSWINLEMADMSKIVFENMLKVVDDLLTDHSCEISTRYYDADIRNSTISFLAACTYPIYNRIWESIIWRGGGKDRILVYYPFSFKRGRVNTDVPRAQITMNLPAQNEIKIETSDFLFNAVVEMLETQFGSERAFEFTEKLLRGSAALNHRFETNEADAKFILLHRTNIQAQQWASRKKSLSSPLVIDMDSLELLGEAVKRFGVSLDWLATKHSLRNEQGQISTESLISSVYAHPKLFKKIENWVFPNPKLMTEKILPQIKFEKMCLQHGPKYYLD